MKLSYDPETDSLYIHLSERVSVDSDELVGIDVQHASQKADIDRLLVSRVPFRHMEAA
jgi:uncharacterized protein YuzE